MNQNKLTWALALSTAFLGGMQVNEIIKPAVAQEAIAQWDVTPVISGGGNYHYAIVANISTGELYSCDDDECELLLPTSD